MLSLEGTYARRAFTPGTGRHLFEQHPTFIEPDPQASVWRYRDFTKFVALIDTRSLWFSKPTLLGDPWELAYTRANLRRFQERLGEVFRDDVLKNYRATLASMFVSCWHMSDVESAAMWRLYLSSLEGVAVQSSWSDLTASIGQTRDPVSGGLVRYIDFEVDDTNDATNMFFPTTTKRLSFAYEQEVRLVTWWRPDRTRGVPDYEQIPQQPGIMVPIDIDRAIHRVVLCPGSSAWFKDLVRRVAARYEFTIPIENSSMETEPTPL